MAGSYSNAAGAMPSSTINIMSGHIAPDYDRAKTSQSQNLNPNARMMNSEFRRVLEEKQSISYRSRLPNLKSDIYNNNYVSGRP